MSFERLTSYLDSQQNKQNCILGADDLNELDSSEILPLKLLILNRKPFFLLHLDSLRNNDADLVELVTLMNDCEVSNFSLTGISIGNKTAIAMVDALQRNSQLKKLAFGGFSIDGEHLRKLGEAIRDHKNLLEFSILCGQSNTKDLFYFAMQIAKNTKLILKNTNGFLTLPVSFQTQTPIHYFIAEFLQQILDRNLQMNQLSTEYERIECYNRFAKESNQGIKEQLAKFSVDLKDIDSNDLYIKPKIVSLKYLCFSFIKSQIKHPQIGPKLNTLPNELQAELPKLQK